MDDNKNSQTAKDSVLPEEDISQVESLVVEDNPALIEAVRGYMSDRQVLIGRIKNLNFNYTKYSLVLEETRKDIAMIDQKIFSLLGPLPEIKQ